MLEVHVGQFSTSFVEKNRFHSCVFIFFPIFPLFPIPYEKLKAADSRTSYNVGGVPEYK